MKINPDMVRDAFRGLTRNEAGKVVCSTSAADARTALTKLSITLLAKALAARPEQEATGLTIGASFKGNKSGRRGGGAGGMLSLGKFAKNTFEAHGVTYTKDALLVDFFVYAADQLTPVMTVESEARPLAPTTGMRDFIKLLLVASPWRAYVGRVNVTATGREHKVTAATNEMRDLFQKAIGLGSVRNDDVLNIVLIRTCNDGERAFYCAEWSVGTSDFALAPMTLAPEPASRNGATVADDRGAHQADALAGRRGGAHK